MTVRARFYGLALVPAGQRHLAAVARSLRPRDRHEAEVLEICAGGSFSVEQRLADGFARSRPRWALVRSATGECLALGGVLSLVSVPPAPDGRLWGSPWMVGTRALDAAPKVVARALAAGLALVRDDFAGLANFILDTGDGSVRLLERLGFATAEAALPNAPRVETDGVVRIFYRKHNKGGRYVHAG